MKKTLLIFSAFLSLFFIACEGPEGPIGPPGQPGLNGSEFVADAFEVNVDMNYNSEANMFEFLASGYEGGAEVFEDDVVLIYRLEEVNNGVDIWRQLPQPVVTDEGITFYNFDFTFSDYSIYLEPDFDATLLGTDLTDDQWFRIVIVPAEVLSSSKMDKSNVQNLLDAMGIKEEQIQKFTLK